MASGLSTLNDRPAWFVAANAKGWDDQTERFIQEGVWQFLANKPEAYSNAINSVEVGDRIAIKSEHERNLASLPFNSEGKKVHSMRIKAIGVVTANPQDGHTLGVDWTPVPEEREWYGYTIAQPIGRVPPSSPRNVYQRTYDALIRFTFDNEPQDFDQFLSSPSEREELEPSSIVDPYEKACTERDEAFVSYNIANILADGCFLDEDILESMLHRLRTKQNIILQGPPGAGKTWLSKRLAYALIGHKDDTKVRQVQFHPNLSYEDFVRGWRPDGERGLVLADGPFLKLCKVAGKDPDSKYVMVIEEINRGNPASIFGELLTLLEADKRSPSDALALAYPHDDNERFYIPPNVYVIGTMNLADRSLALVDFALRRRFAFFDLEPQLNDAWREWVQEKCGIPEDDLADIARRITALNAQIAEDRNLGKQFRIGHSHVTPTPDTPIDDPQQWFTEIVETEIAPLLREYWFDDASRAEEESQKLLSGL